MQCCRCRLQAGWFGFLWQAPADANADVHLTPTRAHPPLSGATYCYAHGPFGCAGHRSLPLMPTDRQTVLGHPPLHAPHALARRRHIFTACPPPCVQLRIPYRRCGAARVCEAT